MRALAHMRWIPLLALLAAAASTASATSPGAERLVNGGFELGSPDGGLIGWSANGAPGLGGSGVRLSDPAAACSGRHCLLLRNDGRVDSEMAMMTPAVGIFPVPYEVKAAVRGRGRFTVYLYQYDAAGAFLHSVPFGAEAPAEWTPFQWTYRPPAGVARVAFALHASGGVYFDDCSLRSTDAAGEIEAAGEPAPESPSSHFLSVPRVASAPRIDGVAGDKEWAAAAATTGFVRTDDSAASAIQPVVQVAYDDAALYVMFVSPIPEGRTLTANVRGSGGPVWEDDDVELLLQPDPPRGTVFHFLAGPAGGHTVQRNGAPYAPAFSYRSGVTEDRWVAEFSIPYAALESEAPADDAVWGVNFCRGHAEPREWTAWSPSLIFADSKTFGRMRFGGDGPSARLMELGNLLRANVDLRGTILADNGRFVFSAGAGVRPEQEPGVVDAGNVHAAGTEGPAMVATALDVTQGHAPLSFERTLELNPSRVTWEITREADKRVIQKHTVDFNPLPPLILSLHSSPAAGTIEVRLDATGMLQPGSRLEGQVRFVESKSGAETISGQAVFDAGSGTAVFDLAHLPVATYRVTATVKSDKGSQAEEAAEFKRAGVVPAEYARTGYEPEVPAPWTPVVVEGRQVGVWNRTITFAGNGLPSSIKTAGREALAGPVVLRAYAGEEELAATPGDAAVEQLSPGAARTTGSVAWKGLQIGATSRTEFDGCIRVDLEVATGSGEGPDRLVLEIPFAPEFADLIHSHLLGYEPTTSGSIPAGTGAVWSHSFTPVVWMGNTHAGVCWFAESQRDWALSSPDLPSQEIIRQADAVVLRIHLAGRSFPPDRVRRIVFGLHPTPVKPLPDGWRRTRMGSANPFLPEDPYFDTHVGDPAGRWWGWPEPKTDEEYERQMEDIRNGTWNREAYSWKVIKDCIDTVRAVGGRMIWYDALQMLSVHNPWYHTYGEDWRLTGHGAIRAYDPWWMAVPVCPAAPEWQDLYIGTLDHAMRTYDYDGVYLDLFYPWRCANPVHGCGYVDDQGRRQAEYTIWAMREQLKRLNRVVHARPNGYIMGHYSGTFIPPVHGFVDSEASGEHYWSHFHTRGAVDFHDILPLDKCRTEVLGRQWGWIPLWLPMFKEVSSRTTRQMLSLILLHDSLVWPANVDAHECHQANAILTRLGFVEAEFVGYFDTPPPASTDDQDVLVSAYRRPGGTPGSAILLIANHGLEDGVFQVTPDHACLELGPGNWQVTEHPDVATSKELTVTEATFPIEIPAKDYRIVCIKAGS